MNHNSSITAGLSPADKAEVVRDAYRKHATELLAIEEAQQKLTIMVLAILGAGASFIGGLQRELTTGVQVGLTVVVGTIVLIGLCHTVMRSRARATTRALLVRCERALGFLEEGAYVLGEQLYGDELKKYPKKGWWLPLSYFLVVAAGVGFLVVVWYS